ncbi:UDP-3-O-(3-hydroxymyristoyl)glucosamine N-acyltransferase [Thiomicrorhabdus sediminis]|uniref:UDP-3-O-acylglucosamine N-acyltransferase n=1 Tax=Thiomicrorhabdus sediminis TaxID=2580412 RepID=A0A4P9K7G0_9GAMM|nr:UDP-3-O-(3-hydroxymyristoyl)glucosamine N-acyltransferase [Thiomicrorhabdus sediminis]QCU90187.1 UDP-3-O-(3-hydroxymyristoyl)glucosamine N-acyltransferase [Thiomicrorhabdus sediminis]
MQLASILEQLAQNAISYELVGSSEVEVEQVAPLDKAVSGQITFLSDKKYQTFLKDSKASAVIVNQANDEFVGTQIVVANPYYVYALVAQILNPLKKAKAGIHQSAVIAHSAKLAETCEISANAVIGENVTIGEGCFIGPNCVLEDNVSIGNNCILRANVTINNDCQLGDSVILEAGCVIGGDGFGWANNQGEWVKIPQIGRVVIGSNVSIGNNTTVDRGAIDDTVIEDNCIIDNMVHIAHNVVIGSGSAIAALTGFAGSSSLGKNCTVAGQVGFAGHIHIADNCHFLAKSGVTNDIKSAGAYAGFPAMDAKEWQKNTVRLRQIDKISKQIKVLQKQLESLSD